MTMYCDTLKGNMQYGIDPYCCISNLDHHSQHRLCHSRQHLLCSQTNNFHLQVNNINNHVINV